MLFDKLEKHAFIQNPLLSNNWKQLKEKIVHLSEQKFGLFRAERPKLTIDEFV